MPQSVLNGDYYISGTLGATRMSIPASAVNNAAVAAGVAGNYVAASKLEGQFAIGLELEDTTSLVNPQTRMAHIVRGVTGEVVGLQAMFMTAATSTSNSFTIDLRKVTAASTGTTMLSTGLTLASTHVVRTVYSAVLSSVDTVVADQLHVVVTTTGTSDSQARGLMVTLTLREDPA